MKNSNELSETRKIFVTLYQTLFKNLQLIFDKVCQVHTTIHYHIQWLFQCAKSTTNRLKQRWLRTLSIEVIITGLTKFILFKQWKRWGVGEGRGERKTGFRDKSRTITLSPLFLCSKGVQTKMSSDIVVITLKRNPQQYFCGTFTTNIRTKYQPTLFPVICYQNQPRALLQCSLNIELGYCFNATQENKQYIAIVYCFPNINLHKILLLQYI